MEKNAEFIRTKEFNIVFKGYKPEEVDKFLDVLSVEFDRLLKKNNELQENLDRLKFESTSTVKDREKDDTGRKKLIEEALISAHKTADEIKSTARKEADEIKTAAQQEADEIIKLRKIEEEKAIEELEGKKSSIEESLVLLQNKYDDFKNQIKEMMEGLNSTVDEVDSKFEVKIEDDAENEEEKDFSPDDIKSPEEDSKDDTKKGKETTGVKESEEQAKETIKEESTEKEKAKENKSEKEAVREDKEKKDLKAKEKRDDQGESTVRERKKIDIANPDIIENFFKANND